MDPSFYLKHAACLLYPQGLHLGGGVNPSNAAQYLDAGASHVIVTSYVFRGKRPLYPLGTRPW